MNGSLARRHGSEAGIALPMTLILMALITSLTVAFLAFTAAEPVIASNQMANAQARAIAESGVERALWALSGGETIPSPAGALADPLPAPVPAPYDGSQYITVGVGEFKVTVTNGAATNERNITAVGYVPNHTNPIAIKKIQTTVTHIKIPTPPCAICAGGEQPVGTATEIRIGGSAAITASTSNGAVYCAGSVPTAAAYAQGTINTNGNPNITGPSGGSALAQNQPTANFTDFLFSDADFNTLKAYARSLGPDHYYQGSQTWTSPPPNGIIVVDTLSGNPLSPSSPSGDAASVDIHGNWSSGWSGWLIVAGSLQISGNTTLSGLIYAQNDVQLHGTGGGSVTGAVVSTNRVDSSSTNIDTDDTGNAPVSYNCPAVRNGGGSVPINWFVKPGTFREVAGS
jgi:Tfp pilus assembly protein PilX